MDDRATYILEERKCTLKEQGRNETVMCLGNGYLGMRSSFCEKVPEQSRLTLLAGLYDKQPCEEEELIPLPDVTELSILADGEEIQPLGDTVREYSRTLNIKNGLMEYMYLYGANLNDSALTISHRRIVSMEQKHLVVMETVFKAHRNVELKVSASVNAKKTVDGTQHSFEEERTVLRDHTLWYGGRAVVAGTQFRVGTRVKIFLNGEDASDHQRYSTTRRLVSTTISHSLKQGDTLRILRYALFYTAHDYEWEKNGDRINDFILSEMDYVSSKGFDQHLSDSEKRWQQIWNSCDIQIGGAPADETLKIRLAMYHMNIMCPRHSDKVSVAAKGLTGLGYAGHVFWDCEIFNLPFFTYTDPNAAKKLCTYRYKTLNGARKKAKEFGFSGAMYPWESAGSNGIEQSPRYKNYSPDNTPRHVTCGEIEHHVVCDVAYGGYLYAKTVNDRDYMERYGYEILFETANFWQSRLDYNPEKDRYEILQVTGPDEYKEYVDNDVFTNYLVSWNLKTALDEGKALQVNSPELFERLNSYLGLTALMDKIEQKLPKLYLPIANEDDLIPQNDTYLNLKQIDLSKYKNSGINRLIYRDYSLRQIGELMVSKQADLIQLFALMPKLFSKGIMKKNFDFYEDKCIHDSSLSLSAFALVATKLDEADLAHSFLTRAWNTDFGEDATLCYEGIHAANCGGIWQTVMFGFMGIQSDGSILKIDPCLPSHWNEVKVNLIWRGSTLCVRASQGAVLVNRISGGKQTICIQGKIVEI